MLQTVPIVPFLLTPFQEGMQEMMKNYRVTWRVDCWAETPEEAIKEALNLMWTVLEPELEVVELYNLKSPSKGD